MAGSRCTEFKEIRVPSSRVEKTPNVIVDEFIRKLLGNVGFSLGPYHALRAGAAARVQGTGGDHNLATSKYKFKTGN